MKKMSFHTGIVTFLSVGLIIMNPYTIYGKPGILVVFFFAFLALRNGIGVDFFGNFIWPALGLFSLAMLGTISSIANGIPQINHPLSAFSFLVMLVAAKGIFSYCNRRNVSFDDFLMIILFVIIFNSVVVLLEIQFDGIRQGIEQFLDPLADASINYSEGFRLRGIASSGGAGLSISVPAAAVILLHLFDKKRIGLAFLVFLFALLITSVMVIGRSGVVLLVVPVFMFMVLLLSRRNGIKSLMRALFFISLFSILIVPILYQFISDFFSDMFGDAFMKYAFDFLLDGSDGIQEEGTVGTVAQFLTVLPTDFPQALIGYGFYGGSAFEPWTDSGISRTFLSIGFLFGALFYFILLRLYLLSFKENRFLIGSIVLLLFIAEAKEGLLYIGVTARLYVLVLVYCYLDAQSKKVLKPARSLDDAAQNGLMPVKQ